MAAQALPRTGRSFLPRSRKVLAAFSDERLVEQVRRGNDAAFEVVYDRHHRGILSFCRHMLANADEAEDAVQQTFLSAYDALRADGRDMRLKPWLYTIARNRCLSILRGRREQPAELEDVPTAGLADEVQRRSELRDLLHDLRGLPVEQRAALVLSEIGDLSHAEVSEIVGCEVAKVKSLVFQARSSLIESRRARDIPCHEIRQELATATGGALRRAPLRRHLRACEGCAEFRDQVMRQRKALAAVLPVVPSLGLKKAALSALGIGGSGGAGGAAAGLGGGAGYLASSSAAVKIVGAVVVASVAVGGEMVIERGAPAPSAQAAEGKPGDQTPSVHGRAAAGALAASRRAAAYSAHQQQAAAGRAKTVKNGARKGTPGAAKTGKQRVARGTAGSSSGSGAPTSSSVTPSAPPPSSNAGGNGNGGGNAGSNAGSNAGGNGVGGGTGAGAQSNNGNHLGAQQSARGGQGVGQGATPTPPGQAGTVGNVNGNGNPTGHVKNGEG